MEAKSRSKGIVYSTWLTSFCISNDVQESVSHTWLRSSRSKCTCSDWCSRACGILLGAEYRQGAFLVSSCVDGEITSKQSEWWINNEHHGGGGQNYLKKNLWIQGTDFTTSALTAALHESKSSEGKISQIKFFWSRKGLTNYSLRAKTCWLPLFINKVLLGHSQDHSFTYYPWLLLCYNGRLE